MKIGLKLWSTNDYYIAHAIELYVNKKIDYIELFIEPDTDGAFLQKWKELTIPYIFHAPHSLRGFNLANRLFENDNRRILEQLQVWVKAINPRHVIFHSGSNGSTKEAIRQFKIFKTEFPDVFTNAVVENKPAMGLSGEKLIGTVPDEIQQIISNVGLGFCCDIGHAISVAAFLKVDYCDLITTFLKLEPAIFHISDGHTENLQDEHLHFGDGNYDFKKIFSVVRNLESSFFSIETKKDTKENLIDFEHDVEFLRNIIYAGN